MSTRNPMNDRYANADEKPQGKTRKSAASAKPTSKAASSVHMEAKQKQKNPAKKGAASAKKGSSNKNSRNYYTPDTPDYKKWHTIWIACIVVAIALTIIGLFARNATGNNRLGIGLVISGDVFLVASILIDVLKVSKIRARYAREQQANRSKKATAQRKQEAEAQKKLEAGDKRTQEYKAAQKAKAEREAAKEQEQAGATKKKKSWNPFSVKDV